MSFNSSEAMDRFTFLIEEAAKSENSTTRVGKLSLADWDEIQYLSALLNYDLPKKVLELVQAKYASTGNVQKTFAERVKRALHLREAYGTGVEASEGGEELLPHFSLDSNDKQRVMKLCSDMRKIVFASAIFDEPHKKRLLNRIAAIEKQVMSKKGLFDVVLGGVSDVGETLGKFGTDIKPLTDRMSEVAQITRKGTQEYDQIPAPEEVKQLPPPEEGGHSAE